MLIEGASNHQGNFHLKPYAGLLLKGVLQFCEDKPLILVGRGPWYKDALKSLGLNYEYQTFGERNRIERWFRHPQSQTQTFYNRFPADTTLTSIARFLESFTAIYNWVLSMAYLDIIKPSINK